jgi:hypothetical protein
MIVMWFQYHMVLFAFHSNTTGVTSGARTANLSRAPEFNPFSVGFVMLNHYVCVLCFVDHCPYVFFPLYCLSFHLRLLITPLVSSNFLWFIFKSDIFSIRRDKSQKIILLWTKMFFFSLISFFETKMMAFKNSDNFSHYHLYSVNCNKTWFYYDVLYKKKL